LNSRNSAIIVNVRHCARRNECKLSWIAGVRDDHFSDFWKKEAGKRETIRRESGIGPARR
jgi:hypothetical protein